MNNKAQMGKIVEITLILVGAIILYLFFIKVTEKSTLEESINACRISVLAQSATEVMPTISGAKSPFDVSCDKRYINFYNTKVELGLSPGNMKPLAVVYGGKKTTKFQTLTDSTVDQVIAEEMRICKYQFGEGKVDIFGNDDNQVFKDQDVCFICSEITFKDVKAAKFNTFLEYTKKTTFSKDLTYYKYLTEDTLEAKDEEITNPLFENYNMWNQPHMQELVSEWEKQVPTIVKSNDPIYINAKSYVDLNIDTTKNYVVFVKMSTPALLNPFLWSNEISLAIVPVDKINNYCDIQAS